MTLLEAARQYLTAGLSILPITADGTKSPALNSWAYLQEHPPSIQEVAQWFGAKSSYGVGIIGGKVSHSLEIIDFDDFTIYQEFLNLADASNLSALVDRIRAGCEQASPRGIHLPYYCPVIAGNKKLAKRPATNEELNAGQKVKSLIETRGEGGYVVAAPSAGKVHPSGIAYAILQGSWSTVATITPEERQELWNLCQTFDKIPVRAEDQRQHTTNRTNGDRPGDLFATATAWGDILRPAGWTWVYQRGEVDYWRRPGKKIGISASTNYAGSDLFYVFSSSTEFDTERGYGKFTVFSLLNYDGDFHAASQELIGKGFGHVREEVPFPGDSDLPPMRVKEQHGNGHAHGDHHYFEMPPEEEGDRDPPESDMPQIGFALTEIGNAERFIDQHGAEVRYCNPWKKWLLWDGKRWLLDDRQLVKKLARLTVRSLYAEASAARSAEQRKKIGAHAMKSETLAALSGLVNLSQMDVPIMPQQLDADPWAFNCLNGTVDLTTGKLSLHDKPALISKISPIVYDPQARAEVWEGFLDTTFDGNQELIAWIQRAVGYSLTGDTREQSFFFCYGTGSNGKSTFLNVMQAMLGEYAEQASFQTFLQVQNETVRNDLAKLQNCRFVAAIEADEGRRLAESLIKQLTGNDAISTRFLYGEYFTFRPQFKIWLAANHKPEIRGTDHAIWRRVKLIPFLCTISEGDRDEFLTNKLKEELPGILSWAVRGCLDWQKERLTPAPEAVMIATASYRKEQDVLGQFLDDCCVLQLSAIVTSADLYDSYKKWCGMNSEQPISQKAIATRLKERGLSNSKNTLTDRMQWTGVGLKHTE